MAKQLDEEAKPVSISEAFHLLYPLKGRFKNTRSTSYQIYTKTLAYVESCHRIQDKAAIEDLKFTLTLLGFSPEEVASLGTLLPQSSDEAKICIPSLNRVDDSILLQAIEKIQSVI